MNIDSPHPKTKPHRHLVMHAPPIGLDMIHYVFELLFHRTDITALRPSLRDSGVFRERTARLTTAKQVDNIFHKVSLEQCKVQHTSPKVVAGSSNQRLVPTEKPPLFLSTSPSERPLEHEGIALGSKLP